MSRIGLATIVAAILGAVSLHGAAAQNASAVVAASSKAMGVDGLNSVKMWGSGATFSLGQSNNANGPWPRTNINDYYRAIDFTKSASLATATTWASPVTGGAAVRGPYVQNITGEQGWAQQLEIWTTPWGFLKGAAANNATSAVRTVGGRRYNVVTWMTPQKSPSGQAYKVVGYIGPQNLVERVETWLENPVFGDMHVEAVYTHYRDRNGLKFPSVMVQNRGGWPVFDAQILGVEGNPADLAKVMTPPPPPPPFNFPASTGPASEQLAEGVWRIRGAYNALAVEMKDYVVVFEPGGQNEARALAIVAETKRVIPGKPIRYGVISHHHFDHTGGLQAAVAEGMTIVTPAVNKAFLERALGGPRTLAPDALAKSGRKPVIEGFAGVKRVFDDGARTFEIHVIQGLPHADGLVIGYLPKEKILVYADMFNLPPPANPVPDPPVVGTQVFLANIERLGLQPERILSVHSLNPDRLATVDDIKASLGRR